MIINMTALEAGRLISERKISAKEVLDETYKEIEKRDGYINAYTLLCKEEAYKQAEEAQRTVDSKAQCSPLAGVPMSVKANISTLGIETNCSSKMLKGYMPVYDATAIERLKAAGAVITGKTNMDEFAMGGSTETSFFGPTKNPWDLERVPGGSSGGSAASVVSGEAFYSLGSDTGGSIRQPCAFCGATGIKPTYGAVSRYGLIAYASSLDAIGPVGKDIYDCAEVLKIISSFDKRDSTSVNAPLKSGKADIKGLKIGLPRQYFTNGLNPVIADKIFAAAKIFEKLGASVSEYDFSDGAITDYTISAYYITACAEASSNLSRYDGIKYGFLQEGCELYESYIKTRSEGFGFEVKRRLMLGAFVLSSGFYDAYYKKAQRVRALIKEEWNRTFDNFDIVLSPVTPTTAYKIGENINDPVKMMLGDMYTVAVNMAGLPAVSLPAGFDESGLPVGMQLIGRAFDEAALIAAAGAFQRETDFHKKIPVLEGINDAV